MQTIWSLQGAARARANSSVGLAVQHSALSTVSVLQAKLDAITGPSMMFGGFAYNGVSFLFRSGAVLAPTYVVGMGS